MKHLSTPQRSLSSFSFLQGRFVSAVTDHYRTTSHVLGNNLHSLVFNPKFLKHIQHP